MNLFHLIVMALIQGAAELLPVSSSAHVIVAQRLMGFDPSSPEMTFLLVMLHTGTMFAVLFYFGSRWKRLLSKQYVGFIVVATGATGVVGLVLKIFIEKVLLGGDKAEVEHLFSNLPLVAFALFCVGILIIYSGRYASKGLPQTELSTKSSLWIGVIQGLCLPFRGFSRSGATISTGLLLGVLRERAEEFSFALAVVLTPAVIVREWHRLMKVSTGPVHLAVGPGLVGMCLSFCSGLLALRLLSNWLEKGRWAYFGYYCVFGSLVVLCISFLSR